MKLPKIHFESTEIKIPLSEELRSPQLKKERGEYQVTGSREDSPVTHTAPAKEGSQADNGTSVTTSSSFHGHNSRFQENMKEKNAKDLI